MKTTPRLSYKLAEAAELLGVSTVTIRRAISRGLITPVRAFRTPLISAVELERFVNQSPTPLTRMTSKD
jgi:excisionase family DNA binding protein